VSCDVGAAEVQKGHVAGTVQDLPAPKGTNAGYPAGKAWVEVCPAATPQCDEPEVAVADAGTGAFDVTVVAGDQSVRAGYCLSGACAPPSGVVFGPPVQVAVATGATVNTSFVIGFRPDAQARRNTTGLFTGANSYKTSVLTVQTLNTNIGVNQKAKYQLRIDNDGNLTEGIKVKASSGSNSAFSVTFAGPGSMPNLATTGRVFTLAPGASKTITVAIKAKATSTPGAKKSILFTATSTGQSPGAKKDLIQVRATRI
jgi:hypothetical protein